MRVLLTGATGYLGHATANALAQAGHAVVSLQRGAGATPHVRSVDVEIGDVTDTLAVRRALAGCDAVIHLAARVSRVDRPRGSHDAINVGGTQTVLREAARRGVRAVYCSSFFALGPSPRGVIADEDGPFVEAPRPSTIYATSKIHSLAVVRAHVRATQADVVITVPGALYGPGPEREANYVTALLRQLVARRLPGLPDGGRTRLTWSYVDDVARGHVAALERGTRGALYLLGGPVASLAEFLGVAARLAQVTLPTRAIPLLLLEGAGALADAWCALRGGQGGLPFITRAEVATYRADWAYDSGHAAGALGYTITPIEDGLRATLRALALPAPLLARAAAAAVAVR